MPRPAEARNHTSVGRGRDSHKRAQMRPTGRKKKKIAPFDIDEYRRMEYWRVSTATKAENRRKNPVKRIGGRRKALRTYLKQVAKTKKLRQCIRGLIKRIDQAESVKRKRSNRARRWQAWTIWGSRTKTERHNDLLVIGNVMKWVGKEVARNRKPKQEDKKSTAMHQGTDQTNRTGRISEKRTK